MSELADQVIALLAAGMTIPQVASETDIPHYRIRKMIAKLGLLVKDARAEANRCVCKRAAISETLRERWLEPEFRRRSLASLRSEETCRKRAAAKARINAEIPSWVPDDLVGDFIDLARDFGEEEAASRVRRLKAEASRAEIATVMEGV